MKYLLIFLVLFYSNVVFSRCDYKPKNIDNIGIKVSRSTEKSSRIVEFEIKNNTNKKIVAFVVGLPERKGAGELQIIPQNIAKEIYSQEGWTGRYIFWEEGIYMHYLFRASNKEAAISSNQKNKFKLILPELTFKEPNDSLYMSEYPINVIDFSSFSYKLRFSSGDCFYNIYDEKVLVKDTEANVDEISSEVKQPETTPSSEQVVSSTETLKISSSGIPKVFGGEVISPSVKKFIAKDINSVFEYAKEYRKYSVNTRRIDIAGEVYESKERIRFLGSGYKPVIFWESVFGDLVKIKGQDYLVVPEQLVNAYKTAIEFAKQNSVAFDKLVEFVNTLNTLGKTPIDRSRLSDLFYFVELNEVEREKFLESYVNNPQALARDFGGIYKQPSILNVIQADWFPGVKEWTISKEDLLVETYRYSDDRMKTGVLGVYKNDTWKKVIMPI